ncbi:hypothetical protein VE25_02190, partial [Devosia geojensis]
MHLLSAQAGALQQEGEAIDLAQTPGEIVYGSFADSELMMLAAAADRAGEAQARDSGRPVPTTLRLANLMRLSHNLSVDLWIENTVRHAKVVVLRLTGGISYFQYGVDELIARGGQARIPLALISGDANPDPILVDRSTVSPAAWSRLHGLIVAGGPDNADRLLAAMKRLAAGEEIDAIDIQPFPRFGLWYPGLGMIEPEALESHHARTHSPPPGGEGPGVGGSLGSYTEPVTPLPTSPTRGEVDAGSHGKRVPVAQSGTSPLAGEKGRGATTASDANPGVTGESELGPPPSPLVGEGARRADEGDTSPLGERSDRETIRVKGPSEPQSLRDHNPPPSPLRGGTEGGGGSVSHRDFPPSPIEGEGSACYAPILFYRAALEGAGTATIEALIAALEARGLKPVPLVISSLKEGPCARMVEAAFERFLPAVILNLTGFALGLDSIEPKANPFAGTDAPVLQLLQNSRPREAWLEDKAGLTPKDLAMQVVLPEVDGRSGMILVGHKHEGVWHERTQCPLSAYAPDEAGIARAADLAANWARLRSTPRPDRRIALVLANYPLRDGRLANGVGYDAPQSTVEILRALEGAGYCLLSTSAAPTSDLGYISV